VNTIIDSVQKKEPKRACPVRVERAYIKDRPKVDPNYAARVWDLETEQELRRLEGHSANVNGVAVSPDGRRVVSASDDKTLKVWDLETGGELRTLQGHSDRVISVAVSPDGRRAVSASWDRTLKVWDLEVGAVVATFTYEASARCCAFAGAHCIVASDFAGRVHFLQLMVKS
jgi:WD40 repeat protein